jgi:osmotically-inducible protein OsmY
VGKSGLIAAIGLLLLAASVERGAARASVQGVAGQVRERLAADELLRDQKIAVTATGLVVTLTGRVRSRGLAERAVELARRVASPHTVVDDELTVEQPPLADDLLEQNVAERLVGVDRTAVVVSIEGGTVILTGIARSQRERERLVEATQQTAGVVRVIDRIQVQPPRDAGMGRD